MNTKEASHTLINWRSVWYQTGPTRSILQFIYTYETPLHLLLCLNTATGVRIATLGTIVILTRS